jgi:very-short-patch-repair endonuclease/DNA modification methylase
MARKKRTRTSDRDGVKDFRHTEARRRNNPPAGVAPTYEVRERQTQKYDYDPHLDPQLVWAGKAEHTSFEVDVVSLHIHERISTSAILQAVRRPEPIQPDLFGETPLPADKQVEFYQHEVDWANRLILGDSLLVMNSLLVKEGMAGKVQMIYIDPPYGIKYASNFQPRIDRRDVKDKDEDLTHEPEQIKAYRDTWKLGIHSYLTYLRDRLLLARELLTESGSIFVQINDENLHLVRCLLDEVFGRENFQGLITFRTAISTNNIFGISDYLLWYSKNYMQTKKRVLFIDRPQEKRESTFSHEDEDGKRFKPTDELWGSSKDALFEPYEFEGKSYQAPRGKGYKWGKMGMKRLEEAGLLWASANYLYGRRYETNFSLMNITNLWNDTATSTFASDKLYAVQTNTKVIERCILMTTDPGDLVFDPTCVRKGTRVLAPTPTLPVDGEGAAPTPTLPVDGEGVRVPPPSTGEVRRGVHPAPTPALPVDGEGACVPPPSTGEVRWGKTITLVPIEHLQPGDFVLGHDGQPHRVLRVIRKRHRGLMVGIHHSFCSETLWCTADHRILCKPRPRTLGGDRDWSASPLSHLERRRTLRREMTEPEKQLWRALRNRQMGVKFRRQHPIGAYIADFYSRDAHLVVEIDGSTHFEPDAMEYDRQRDAYMRALGLDILRFTAQEVQENLEGVCLAIQNQCRLRMESVQGAVWLQAGSLQPGDVVFFGPDRVAVPVESVEYAYADEEVYDLEVEGVHSFLTEVCAVHNCGSGTTAYCAEKWGRRWITCDTSRVALAIARQRLMTAKFDYYELREPERGPAGGFIYETVPHITLESIAKNTEIDAIAAKYQPEIDRALADLNRALGEDWKEWEVPREVPHPLWSDEAKQAYERLRSLGEIKTPKEQEEAERLLELIYRQTGHRWTLKDIPDPVPADDWSDDAKQALRRFWELKRAKRQEIDASIQRNAPQETLYDRPKVINGVVRVSGPFTVEAIPVPVVEDPTQAPIPQFETEEAYARVSDRGGDYLTTMINLLKQQGGVLFPGGKKLELANIRPLNLGYLHAEAEATQNGSIQRVAISLGPQHGPVIAHQVQEAIPTARMNGYNILIFAGFAFDPEAQALIQKVPVAGLQVHFANIAPDVLVGDLLKTTRASQIFTVFGQPDVRISPSPFTGRVGVGATPSPFTGRAGEGATASPSTGRAGEGATASPSTGRAGEGATPSPSTGRVGVGATYIVELRGVDIYDPLTGEVHSTRGEDVAAWFLDADYDGKTFRISQAFFPGDPDAWEKLQRALKAHIDPEAFERMRGTVSFPFQLGEHKRIAVKVIDFRGNEVMRVVKLAEEVDYQ